MQIGIISDTHGLLRPEAVDALRGCERILHAGDIGKPEILEALEFIAPVVAVRGNNDAAEWADAIPETQQVTFQATRIYLLHDLKELDLDPVQEGFDIVIAGHSHKPRMERRDDVLYLNPGSAGPRRFSLPATVAQLEITQDDVRAEIIELDIPKRNRPK